MRFFFGNNLRIQWVFLTPNYFASFIAMCFPAIWFLEGLRCRFNLAYNIFLQSIECLGICLLVLTYSRSGFLAFGAAAGLFFLGNRETDFLFLAQRIRQFLQRIILVIIIGEIVDFWKRSNPAYIARDNSVLHRIDIWRGAAILFSARPLHGWGWGTSGQNYVNWVQDSGPTNYIGVLNTFLQIDVELGFFIGITFLGVVLAVILTPLLIPSAPSARRMKMSRMGASSIAAWGVSNLFSTLGASMTINVMAVAAAGCSFSLLLRNDIGRNSRLLASVSSIGALTITSGILALGWFLNDNKTAQVSFSNGVISYGSKKATRSINVFVDPEIIGPFFGKNLRRLVAEEHYDCSLNVITTELFKFKNTSDTVVYIGDQWVKSDFNNNYKKRIFFYPRIFSSQAKIPPGADVWLPTGTIEPDDEVWRLFCIRSGAILHETSSSDHWFTDKPWPDFLQ